MGWLDRVRLAKALAGEVYSTVPHWARILRVGRRFGPFVALDLEIHSGYNPVEVVSTTTWVPRGLTPAVGQHVAFSVSHGDDTTSYQVVWDRPPQYGTPGPPATR